MMVSGVCLCSSAPVFITNKISRQILSSNGTATTAHVLMDDGYALPRSVLESVPVAVIHTTNHLTGSSSPSWADVSTF